MERPRGPLSWASVSMAKVPYQFPEMRSADPYAKGLMLSRDWKSVWPLLLSLCPRPRRLVGQASYLAKVVSADFLFGVAREVRLGSQKSSGRSRPAF
jgi:hypothetical protein